MLRQLRIEDILFLDIETVPQQPDYEKLSPHMQQLWDKKISFHTKKTGQAPKEAYAKAAIFAEFGKVICISAGVVFFKEKQKHFRIKSFFGHDEKQLLSDFAALLNQMNKKSALLLCAHNGKEFDFPYLARRMLIQQIQLPYVLDIAGKKPWEVKHLDTLELWKFGDYKHYTSLELLTCIFDIPTPKDDIRGSDVAQVYWQENNIERIVAYCEKDVLAVAQLFLRYRNQALIEPENVQYARLSPKGEKK